MPVKCCSDNLQLKKDGEQNAGVTEHDCGSDIIMPTPPDGGWGWVVMFAGFLSSLLLDGVAFSFGIFYLEFLHYFQESKGKTAWAGAVMTATINSSGLIASGLMRRYGARSLAVGGSVLAAIALILSTISPNVDILIVTYGFMAGLGFGAMYLPATVMVGFYFEKRRAFATGVVTCGSAVGAFIYPPLAEKLIEIYGWKGALCIIAGLSLNGVVTGALFRPLRKSRLDRQQRLLQQHGIDRPVYGNKNQEYDGSLSAFSRRAHTILINTRCAFRKMFDLTLLKDPVFLLYGISSFLYMSSIMVPLMYLPDYAIDMGVTRDRAALLLVACGASNILSRIVFGLITDQPWADCLRINNLALITGGIVVICCPLSTHYWLLCIYAVVVGSVHGVYVLLRSIILIELLGIEHFTKSFGILSLCGGLGALVGIQLGGSLYDLTGSYHVTYYTAGSIMVTSGLICLPLRRLAAWKKKRKTDRINRTHLNGSHEEYILVVPPLSVT